MRRNAEEAQDRAEQTNRELEQSLAQVREECDQVHEELAFTQSELEEVKLELEVEKQDLQNELASVRQQVRQQENGDRSIGSAQPAPRNDEYEKKLEEELELVTEQLIELEQKLNESDSHRGQLQKQLVDSASQSNAGDAELIQSLQAENADRLETERRLRDQLNMTQDELGLSKEEIALQQEELQAAEEDYKQTKMELEELQAQYRERISQLQIQVKEAEMASKNSLGEAAMVATTVTKANDENWKLAEEVAALESALELSKKDYQSIVNELEEVNARFDEARDEAFREGEARAQEAAREARKSDDRHEIEQVRAELAKLTDDNKLLQEKVDATSVELAAARDDSNGAKAKDAEKSEVVQQLQSQLTRGKDEIEKKDAEITELRKALDEGVSKTEEKVRHLDMQLRNAKSQFEEAESRIVVFKREKERAESKMADLQSDQRALDEKKAREENSPTVAQLEQQLEEERKRLTELQENYESLQDQKRMGEVRNKRMEEDLCFLQKQVFGTGGDGAVVTQMNRLSSLANNKSVDVMTEQDTNAGRINEIIQSRDVKTMATELKTLEKRCNSQREYNAQLLSKMLHLQGNIQVYCRIRPMSMNEIEKGLKCVAEPLSETEVGCFDSRTNKWKSFAFDRVWGPDQSQQSVFQDVEPLALSVVDGFNACIFAYGQTGSGKTYTMEGTQEDNQYGISYRTIQKIFHLLTLRAQQQRAAEMFVGSDQENEPAKEVAFSFSITVGMLEIYNDEIFDLLNTSGASMEEKKQGAMKAGGKGSLDIRRDQVGRIEVPNLTKEKVDTIEEVMEILKRGNANRATASTDMNEHSSRSHMVLMVDVVSGLDEAQSNKGTLYLVDLAGSERVRKSNVAGDQLKEAGFINKSLSALGNVMEALDRKASHIPYRDSKLTFMLQDSLGGNSRTMMVVAICPNDNSLDESVNALQFATRVRRIQIGAAQRNVTGKNLEETVKSLTEEMRSLTRAKERSESQLLSLKRDNTRVQEKLQNLSKSRQQNRSDSKTLEVLRKNNDDMAARWQKEKAAREETGEELETTRRELRNVQQQVSKMKTQIKGLEKSLETKEGELESVGRQLIDVKNTKTAANARARRDQVLSARQRTSSLQQPSKSPRAQAASPSVASQSTRASSATEQNEASTTDVSAVREKVLQLLQKHDPVKVDRIDIIMDKFEGKEELLLEKMTARYEGSSTNSFLERNRMSIERHQERMKRIRDMKANRK